MRFRIHSIALNGEDELLRAIDWIVDRVADEVHALEVAADEIEGSRWYERSPPRRKLVKKYVAQPSARGRDPDASLPLHARTVEVKDGPTAAAARRLACEPLHLLVEDSEADGRFLEIAVHELGGDLADLWERCKKASPEGLQFVSASISQMSARLRELATKAENRGTEPRLLVIHDSDRRWPDDEEAPSARHAKTIAERCDKHRASYHCLQKRSIENYIPDPVFKALRDQSSDTRASIAAFLALAPHQRDFFPLKGEMNRTERELATDRGHYTAADAAHLDTLEQQPIFTKKGRPMTKLLDKDKLDLRDAFTAEGLRLRDGVGELEQILRKIAEVL